jgi:hypothetical protein
MNKLVSGYLPGRACRPQALSTLKVPIPRKIYGDIAKRISDL